MNERWTKLGIYMMRDEFADHYIDQTDESAWHGAHTHICMRHIRASIAWRLIDRAPTQQQFETLLRCRRCTRQATNHVHDSRAHRKHTHTRARSLPKFLQLPSLRPMASAESDNWLLDFLLEEPGASAGSASSQQRAAAETNRAQLQEPAAPGAAAAAAALTVEASGTTSANDAAQPSCACVVCFIL